MKFIEHLNNCMIKANILHTGDGLLNYPVEFECYLFANPQFDPWYPTTKQYDLLS